MVERIYYELFNPQKDNDICDGFAKNKLNSNKTTERMSYK